MDMNTPFAGQGRATTQLVPSDKSLWTELLAYWTGRRWTEQAWLPRSEETTRVVEQAIGTCRTLLSANRLATEAICDAASHQQAIAFDMARASIAACAARKAGVDLNGADAPWKCITTACAEANLQGLEVVRAVTDTAFKVLHHTSEAALAAGTAGAPRP